VELKVLLQPFLGTQQLGSHGSIGQVHGNGFNEALNCPLHCEPVIPDVQLVGYVLLHKSVKKVSLQHVKHGPKVLLHLLGHTPGMNPPPLKLHSANEVLKVQFEINRPQSSK
jgi:hypothetical protein